jgi:sigma-E factor negative regulatory protein RseA
MSQNSAKHTFEESLSALIDGEITEFELRRLLKADNEQYEGLRKKWGAYQLASSSLKGALPDVAFHDISNSIRAAIDEEPALSTSVKSVSRNRLQSIWSGVGRFAIAASVAGAVVLGVQFTVDDPSSQIASVDAVPVAPAKVPSSFGHGLPVDTTIRTVSNESKVVKPTQEIILNAETQQQLQEAEAEVNRLMLEHAQNASQNTQQGVLPYARVPESSKNP